MMGKVLGFVLFLLIAAAALWHTDSGDLGWFLIRVSQFPSRLNWLP